MNLLGLSVGVALTAFVGLGTLNVAHSVMSSVQHSVAQKFIGGFCGGNEMGPYLLEVSVHRGMSGGWEKVNNSAFTAN